MSAALFPALCGGTGPCKTRKGGGSLVFSSVLFLFQYLPLVLLAYYLTPLRWRNVVLLVLNLVFYGWGEPVYIRSEERRVGKECS